MKIIALIHLLFGWPAQAFVCEYSYEKEGGSQTAFIRGDNEHYAARHSVTGEEVFRYEVVNRLELTTSLILRGERSNKEGKIRTSYLQVPRELPGLGRFVWGKELGAARYVYCRP